jgi:putative SOS response-associated peptidase YedK
MCGRYVSTKSTADLLEEFDAELPPEREDEPAADTAGIDATVGINYNVAPTVPVRIVLDRAPAKDAAPVRQLRVARWGLVPSWAKDVAVGNRLFNARADTVDSKPAFRRAFAVRRCLLPADGWYEWRREDGPDGKPVKQPYLMTRPDGASLAFAGLYEFWKQPGSDGEPAQWLTSATILTVDSQGPLQAIHDRMPLVLGAADWKRWLDPSLEGPLDLLEPYDEAAVAHLQLIPVSTAVNNARNNSAELIEPAIDPQPLAQTLFP